MAKGIPTLIKLKKREVDELRKAIAELDRQKELLAGIIVQLQRQLEEEAKLIEQTPEMGAYFVGYRTRVRKRQEDIAKEIASLEHRMAGLREQLAGVFGEQKRYEIVEQNARNRERKEQDRKEQIRLDEVGTNQFVRTGDHGAS